MVKKRNEKSQKMITEADILANKELVEKILESSDKIVGPARTASKYIEYLERLKHEK